MAETRLNDDPQQHQSDDDCSMMREDSSDDGGDDGQASVDDGNDQQSEDDDDDRSEYSYYLSSDDEDDGTGGEGCAVSMTDVPMAAAPVAGVKRKGKGAIKGEGSYIKVMICCVTPSLGLGGTYNKVGPVVVVFIGVIEDI